ncbi:hypothetical protein A6V39_02435 [Candidatus Mycoplasma haematobovis]|uniref:L-threonylcarbamoyladenylate synthase n=1 Tax=Candidatus Mycoplasma haematobovis TaxID=432608 RepID=A0A1A9QEZ6_9MOLU|nr:hypothetical protein A6V39_02435 [Candidatus Mycoplasma haematobovis]
MFKFLINKIKKGKPIVINTGTVFGLLSTKENNIYKLKNREKNKKNILLISDIGQIGKKLPEEFKKLAKEFWPGSLTLIYEKQGYRIPKNKILLKILRSTGPLWSSSANMSGQNPIKNLKEAKRIFKDKVLYVSASNKLSNEPSTIYDFDEKKIVREGKLALKLTSLY